MRLKSALIERGLLEKRESHELGGQACSKRKSVEAKEFVASFRAVPDDFHLMRKYGLKPKQLKKVYNTLISRGALSEYEFHCRWGKAPEPEEATASLTDSSTGVSLVESFSEETLRLFRSGRSAPQTEEPPRHMPSRPSSQPPSRSKRRSNADEDAMERCPNCGRAKTSQSHDSCLYCGIVFSKMSHSDKYRGVAIWDRDTR